ncbi:MULTISPECIES: helix-turn-helix domain-containing protein [Paraburkholderia]
MSLRQEFVHLASQHTLTMTELCQRFSISRQTGYKWLDRGENALSDQSRRPASSPSKTSAAIFSHRSICHQCAAGSPGVPHASHAGCSVLV